MPPAKTLLLDALDRTLLEPQCARRWLGLATAWVDTADPAVNQVFCRRRRCRRKSEEKLATTSRSSLAAAAMA